MKHPDSRPVPQAAAGFTLPAILVVVGGLMVLAVGILLVAGIERSTARSFVDRQRAELAARAGLEDVRGLLARESANDDFLILQSTLESPVTPGREPAPHYFIARGQEENGDYAYRYVPLFSTASSPSPAPLAAPALEPLVGSNASEHIDFTTLPWQDKVRAQWLPVRDAKGRTIARYAYWIEDLQARIDPKIAGNQKGSGNTHARVEFPFPAPGLNDQPLADDQAPLDQIALFALNPAATDAQQETLAKNLIDNRELLVSPESTLAAAGVRPPLTRDPAGQLVDPVSRAAEEGLVAGLQPYLEQPLVPFSDGIDPSVAGDPKLNLNRMVATGGEAAVTEMADFIRKALPEFDDRKGGFPDDYLKTIAAGAIDYADADGEPTVSPGSHLGLDSYPLLSEVVLHIDFKGAQKVDSRWVLSWTFKLFAELWNMTNQPIENGSARLSYEVNLLPEPIGASAESLPFDDPSILLDSAQSQHSLTQIDGKFYSPPVTISLQPDEYRFYEFATVEYTVEYSPQFSSNGKPKSETFDLAEPELDRRGITLLWNDQPAHTIPTIVRDAYGVSNFKTTTPEKAAKACIPGHSYGPYGFFVNNMGDPRIAPYLRTTSLGENAYPDNVSPHRRNIRRKTIYDMESNGRKIRHYGRVMPSEWPDGGHDSPTGRFSVATNSSILPTNTSWWPASGVPAPLAENAPQRISNLGRFHSATELGRIHDPVLWQHSYTDLPGRPGSGAADTRLLLDLSTPTMPTTRNQWPEVTTAAVPSTDYGGGNTLRIGRPEHGGFNRPGKRAAQLLDLFHTGIPASGNAADREGDLVRIHGAVNVNTAGKGALRAMAAGILKQDPQLCRVTSWLHDTSTGLFGPQTQPLELDAPDLIADAILLRRPFASPSEMAAITTADGRTVFGNRDLYDDPEKIKWSDAAAEEAFARVYDASTVRSRNFRLWVVGQAVTGSEDQPEILAESRRVFTIFSDPGDRNADGTVDPLKHQLKVIHENDF